MPNEEATHIKVLTLDSETTGLGKNDEPISVGMLLHTVEVKSGRATGEARQYEGLRKPNVPIHPAAMKVHGIQDHALEGLDFEHDTVRSFISSADVIISHNAAFDARMLMKLYPEITRKPWRCSWRQWPWTSKTEGRKLGNAAALCGVQNTANHQALADAQTLWQCLQTPTGKTARSRVYLHKLLAAAPFQIDYYIAQDNKRQDDRHVFQDTKRKEVKSKPGLPLGAERILRWIGGIVLLILLLRCIP